MVGVAKNLNVRITLTLKKNKQQLKWCVGRNSFPLRDYGTTVAHVSSVFSTLPWELYFYCYCTNYPAHGGEQESLML